MYLWTYVYITRYAEASWNVVELYIKVRSIWPWLTFDLYYSKCGLICILFKTFVHMQTHHMNGMVEKPKSDNCDLYLISTIFTAATKKHKLDLSPTLRTDLVRISFEPLLTVPNFTTKDASSFQWCSMPTFSSNQNVY